MRSTRCSRRSRRAASIPADRGHRRFCAAARQCVSERERADRPRAARPAAAARRTARTRYRVRSSPIWMDSSTSVRGEGNRRRAWRRRQLLRLKTGSRAYERFTGPQIRKFLKTYRHGVRVTDRIHLVSSYLASPLAGRHAPLDPGDGSGMNLMDLATAAWWPAALEATAPDLAAKLPPIALAFAVVGALAPDWQKRYGLPPAPIIVWTGDNPSSLIGTGLVQKASGDLAWHQRHDFYADARAATRTDRHRPPVRSADRRFHGINLFRQRLDGARTRAGSVRPDWAGFSAALASTPPGNRRSSSLALVRSRDHTIGRRCRRATLRGGAR